MLSDEPKQKAHWEISPELVASIKAGQELTAREELILQLAEESNGCTSHANATVPIKVKHKDDAVLLLYPDGPQHESRSTSIVQSSNDRLFWANLLVACDGPDAHLRADLTPHLIKRSQAKLTNTKNDLDAFVRYYQPMRIGDPTLVCPRGAPFKSPGFFDITKRLDNPTSVELVDAVAEIRNWIALNLNDPEFVSVQINFMFAGHGYGGVSKESGIVISDGQLSSRQLGRLLLNALPDSSIDLSPSRLDLFLDCCHSGAVASDIADSVCHEQASDPVRFEKRSRLGFGNIFCSCLEDEESQELDELQHGLFTFAFLNEFSRSQPARASEYNLAVRDVGWFTNSEQHPFAIFFRGTQTDSNFPQMTYYGAKLFPGIDLLSVGTTTLNKSFQEFIEHTPETNGEVLVNPVAIASRAMRYLREEFLENERELTKSPSTRQVFNRDEFNDREAYWH